MSEYWKQRQRQLENRMHKKTIEVIEEQEKIYRKAKKELENQILDLSKKILNENGVLTYTNAKKKLSKSEYEEFSWRIEEYIEKANEYNKSEELKLQLERAALKHRIDALEAMKLEIKMTLNKLAIEREKLTRDHLENVFEEAFYSTSYNTAIETGKTKYIRKLDKKSINQALKSSWAMDGKNFSERIWSNTEKLKVKLTENLQRNIALGKSPYEAVESISKEFEVDKGRAATLVQTETSAVISNATKESYLEHDLEKYEIVATLDEVTSKVCGSLDGKVFEMKDYEVGVTAPPFHPNCRTTTVPYFEDLDENETRKARDLDGKDLDVSSNMKYEEWKEKFVSSENVEKLNKMHTNRNKDYNQFEKYKRVLGKENVPESFANFVEMKYNNSIEWETKKREYNTIDSIKNKKWTDEFKQKTIDAYYEFREQGIEVSDHFLSNYINRVGKKGITENLVIDMYKNYSPNYTDLNSRNIKNNVRFYNGYRLITNANDTEIISIHKSNRIKPEWEGIT